MGWPALHHFYPSRREQRLQRNHPLHQRTGQSHGLEHHRVSIYDAVDQGLVDRINKISGRRDLPAQFIHRLRSECLDEEQWQQEYCCQPSDENSAFITWEMITSCE